MACFEQQLSLVAIGRMAAIKGDCFNTRPDARRLAFFFIANLFCVILELNYKNKIKRHLLIPARAWSCGNGAGSSVEACRTVVAVPKL
jgi:hypothetical protein